MNYKKLLPETPGIIENYTKFSVAIVIQEIKGRDYIILQERSANLNSQPGEISLPGGGIEENESDKDAAIRETCEELLVQPEDLEYYGQLDSLITSYGLNISVFLMRLNKDQPLESWNEDEVAKIHYLAVDEVAKDRPAYKVKTQHVFEDDFPFDYIQGGRNYPFGTMETNYYFYPLEDTWVWGLTARILYYFGERIRKNESLS